MPNEKIYKIGTRGSLLALTQCLQLKNHMEEMGLGKFELEIIKTQGDEDTSKPLWQLDGKDFFTKELDAALLTKKVDLVVHSYKDLGSERPAGIKLAAITKRKYPHDILFIKKEVVEKLKEKKVEKLVVGTSSPRRMYNIEKNLHNFLPNGEGLKVETKSLRGNVNTRLEKCAGPEYDAIVLALPGIERLATGLDSSNNEAYERHGNPKEILKKLLSDLDFMILPTSQFPAAASQGALGVECLEDNEDLLKKLDSLNCSKTINEVKKEREIFASFGGGCHLAVGITAREVANSIRLNVNGTSDNVEVERHELLKNEEGPKINKGLKAEEIFIGVQAQVRKTKSTLAGCLYDELMQKEKISLPETQRPLPFTDILIASGAALNNGYEYLDKVSNSWLWSSGTRTWKKMAAKGIWCHGSADALGEEEVKTLRESQLLTLMAGKPKWCVVTNNTSENILGERAAVYQTAPQPSSDKAYREKIEKAVVFYWTSFNQYQHYKNEFTINSEAIHFCGLGKTYQKFMNESIKIHPISGMKEFKKWCEERI